MQWKLGAETFTDADSNGRESLVKGGTTTGHTIEGLAAGTARDVRVVATRTGAATPAAVPTRSLLSVRPASVAEDAGAAVTVDVTAAFPAGAAALVTDATVTVRVLPESTAVVGTDYAIAPATRAIVIPAEAASATLAITDDDVSGLTVSTTALDVAEAGGTRTYTVRLNTWPSADVTVGTDQPTPSRRTRPDGTEKVREIERRRPGPTKRLPPPRRNGTAVIDGATLRCAII